MTSTTKNIIAGVLFIIALAFAVRGANALDNDPRNRGEAYLLLKQFIISDEGTLPVVLAFQAAGLKVVQDSSLREVTVIWNTNEARSRETVEFLCEEFPTTEGWTIYVIDSNANFLFATTCPGQG